MRESRKISPDKAANTGWFVMYRAASEIEELADIGRTPFEDMTAEQAAKWTDHPLTHLGCKGLDAVSAWLDDQAERVYEEMAKE